MSAVTDVADVFSMFSRGCLDIESRMAEEESGVEMRGGGVGG